MKHFWMIAAILLCGTLNANAFDYTVKRISNPCRGERQVDGLMPGGDRENSYAWRMAMRGDFIYIATARNIASALINLYAPNFTQSGMSLDDFWTLINTVTNGDIPRNDNNEGANIIEYNRKTGAFRVVYTGEPGVYFRMAVTFGDNVYFGSYSADPSAEQYILKLDTDGFFTKVFETTGSVSLRANCEYDNHLFFAGADDREVVEGDRTPAAKMAVLRKSNDDDRVWERVADYKDFGEIAFDPIMSSWAGAPIWELASHNGYIYATAPSTAGFVIFRGHPAVEGETANEYGWYWEEVAGKNNGKNNPGLSEVEGGEPGTMRSLIGSVYEFKGQLYAYNFDHAFGGVATAFAGMMKSMAGQYVKPSEYLEYMYNSLHNPQKVWRLNDETGKFEELRNFTRFMEGTTNEYIWRLGEHNGQLYVATMDAGIFYNYITQLTNGNFIRMTPEERVSQLRYLAEAIEMLLKMKGDEMAEELKLKLDAVKLFLSLYIDYEVGEDHILLVIDFKEMLDGIAALIQAKLDELPGDTVEEKLFLQFLSELNEKVQDLIGRIDMEGVAKYCYINDRVRSNVWGFDLFRTTDGEDFEVITRSGLHDKYNYGCPSFLSTEEGLYFGTCNPFYGGQLYLLNDRGGSTDIIELPVFDGNTDNNGTAAKSSYYTLDGRQIPGKPTQKGVYIHNGKKQVIK